MPDALLTNYRLPDGTPGEGLAVRDGRFALPRGDEPRHDLQGRVLLPKFVDNHCHILPTGLDLRKPTLAGAKSKAEALDRLSQALKTTEGPLHAVLYDPTALPAEDEITRADLDALHGERPVLVRFVSGHASVANSAMLALARVDEGTPDPSGGIFRHDAYGRLDGVATEDAHEHLTNALPRPSREEMVEAILRAGESMAVYGIGTATDMMTGRFHLEDELWAYAEAARRNNPIRVRLYVQWRDVFGPRGLGVETFRALTGALDEDKVAVRGIKLFADGAIGSATAAIYGHYADEAPGGPILSKGGLTLSGDKSGQLIYAPEKLTAMTVAASEAGYSVAIHAIGDYACDLVMNAFQATGDPSRHRIEHAMMLSDAQIERLAHLNPSVTFQPEFLSHFGHLYRRRLGPERAAGLKRMRSVLDAGLRTSFSSDRPIVAGDPRAGISLATRREDGGETVTPDEALLAYTQWAAAANGDEGTLGTLTPGALADWQTENP